MMSSPPFTFWLGTHQPSWLGRTEAPLMISFRRLRQRRSLPRARGPWVLDSGGFSELSLHGRWTVTPEEYVQATRRIAAQAGNLAWIAPQDWMCEPTVLARTGLSIAAHQQRTVANFLQLRGLAPELPFVAVLQGWTTADYLRCVRLYQRAGIDLSRMPLVGLGSVCRRQASGEIADLIVALHNHAGIRLHGFGIKRAGLRRAGDRLMSADSMAWSYQARRQRLRLPGCAHRTCSNCLRYALRWRSELLQELPGTRAADNHLRTPGPTAAAYPFASPLASLNAQRSCRSAQATATPGARTDARRPARIPGGRADGFSARTGSPHGGKS